MNVKLQAQSRYNNAKQFYFAKKGQVTEEVYSTMHPSLTEDSDDLFIAHICIHDFKTI